jgi:hypothetical protein
MVRIASHPDACLPRHPQTDYLLTRPNPHSIRSLLPLRARRRAHRARQETLKPAHIRHHRAAVITLAGRWLPGWAQRVERC